MVRRKGEKGGAKKEKSGKHGIKGKHVIDPCTFLISSHVNTALIMLWIRRRLESQAINKQVIVPIHS